jgi:hypothetical protein
MGSQKILIPYSARLFNISVSNDKAMLCEEWYCEMNVIDDRDDSQRNRHCLILR